MHLPRRHRRRLLFPPGLLALATLLLLGGVALRWWEEPLREKRVVQLTLPQRPTSDTVWHYSGLRPDTAALLYSRLPRLRAWQDFHLGRGRAADSLTEGRLRQAIQLVATQYPAGIRVAFGPGSCYSSLIVTLDTLAPGSIRHWFIDVNHGPATLYVITEKPLPACDLGHCLPAIGGNDLTNWRCLMPWTPPLPSWPAQLRTSLRDDVRTLAQPEWRKALWLLAGLAALSGWRQQRAARSPAPG